ncbi:MAG: metal ABC transporter ATP-binding protein [Lachnospiraceae bacterium]|jgi:zinc transport system ATP-binding protein|nr:metal ABC transporter ATP-binding protein [Lachnospiraceae bacterium]MDE7059073.1 metal ABC transporter ATP-binding protein [Lachnospiraceae bacterium]
MAQLICRDVVLGYEGKAVVQHLNFEVNQGDYLCIVGENGSGKSTLIKALLQLKKPMAGEILSGDGLEADGIGYLPQQTIVQRDFPASVQEIVRSGCLGRFGWRPFYGKAEKAVAEENMEKLGITHLAKRCYRELSGGQQQRVLLARALCATKYMLLLDEPVAGLDPVAIQEMYDLLERLNQEEKITIIMVSHDIRAALTYASHILHISEEPLFFGTKEDYLKSEIGRSYLSVTGGKRHA